MEDLLKLVELTKKKGQRSIQLVNLNFRKKEVSKDNQLYDGIADGLFSTDDAAAREMFEAHPGNRNYRNAKAKLRQKLLNQLYFLDYDKSSYTQYNKCEYECRHMLHQCIILINEGQPEIAHRILPQVIKTAKQFECLDLLTEALSLQRNEYARLGKVTPYKEVTEELKYQQKVKAAVDKAEEEYYNIQVYVNKSVSAQNRIMGKMPTTINSIEASAKEFKSRQLERLAFILRCQYNELSWNFEENVRICTEIEERYLKVDTCNVEVNLSKKDIALTKLKAYYNLNNTEEGSIYAQKLSKIFKPGSPKWFTMMELYFLITMKGRKYKKAGELYRKLRTNKNYSELAEMDKERWQIYRAFLILVNDSKLLRWGFNLEEYVQALPEFAREYGCYNTATLIVQAMFLLREGQVDELRERVEILQQFNSTHLDKRHNYRNSIFIRMLSIVLEKDFNAEAVEEKGKSYLRKLKKIDIPSDPVSDIEVISYEDLFQMIINTLRDNKLYIHYRFYNVAAAQQIG